MKVRRNALFALAILAFSVLASAGCTGGEAGDLSDEQKIKQASAGRQQQTGQQSGQMPSGGQ